jgi:hypothetical protein
MYQDSLTSVLKFILKSDLWFLCVIPAIIISYLGHFFQIFKILDISYSLCFHPDPNSGVFKCPCKHNFWYGLFRLLDLDTNCDCGLFRIFNLDTLIWLLFGRLKCDSRRVWTIKKGWLLHLTSGLSRALCLINLLDLYSIRDFPIYHKHETDNLTQCKSSAWMLASY